MVKASRASHFKEELPSTSSQQDQYHYNDYYNYHPHYCNCYVAHYCWCCT